MSPRYVANAKREIDTLHWVFQTTRAQRSLEFHRTEHPKLMNRLYDGTACDSRRLTLVDRMRLRSRTRMRLCRMTVRLRPWSKTKR